MVSAHTLEVSFAHREVLGRRRQGKVIHGVYLLLGKFLCWRHDAGTAVLPESGKEDMR